MTLPPPSRLPEQARLERLVALFQAGQLDAAEQQARALVGQYPDFGLGWKVLGAVLRQNGQAEQAVACMRKAMQLMPADAEIHSNLGNALKDLGQLQEAIACHQQALRLKPDFAQAHNNLGNVYRAQGQLDQAEASYRSALALAPGHAQALGNLGLTLKDLQRLPEAHQVLQEATRLHPGLAQAWGHLGATLNEMGDLPQAEAALRHCLVLQPGYAQAHADLGISLRNQGRLAEARASLEQAIALAPDHPEAHNSLGAVLSDLDLPQEALARWRQTVALNPRHAGAITNLASTLASFGAFDEALACFQQALQAKPDFREAHDNLLFTLNYHPDLAAEEIFQAYARFDSLLGQPLRSKQPARQAKGGASGRLRIGYVSPDFRRHSCRYFLEPLLARHDKTAVEVFAYAELVQEDATSQQLRSHVDHWRPTWGQTDNALAQQIAADGIDILVDLAGHTAGNRLAVFARKPAPVSVSWLGYGYTTGLAAIDHFLTDWHSVPAGAETLFSESPWRLDQPALAYRPDAAMPPPSPLPAQRHGRVTFGTFTRAIRINRHTLRAWAAILKRLPQARLVVDSRDFSNPSMQQRLAGQFNELGIPAERLQIGYHSPPWPLMQQVDICLDCFPHNSGTTLLESLYMGVPFVTLAARPSVGRLGSAILHGVGHPEWITHTAEQYVDIATALATDTAALARLRAGLRTTLQASPLMDETGFARQVENAYRAMWERCQA